MGMIKIHLKELLEKDEISIRQYARDIDYTFENVRRFHNGDTKRIPTELLVRTCEYFDCKLSTVITYEE